MEFKGTKGPWVVDGEFIIEKETEFVICDYVPNSEYDSIFSVSTRQAKANALLISNAPEMLETLIEIRNRIESGKSLTKTNHMVTIDNLIKKSTTI